MRSYVHHLGDWMTHTAYCDWMVYAAYHKLVAAYYVSEQPLPANVQHIFRAIGAITPAEKDATRNALTQFFVAAPDGRWHQKRCDEEIERSHRFNDSQRKNIKKRWEGKEGTTANSSNGHDLSSSLVQTLKMGNTRTTDLGNSKAPPRTSPHVSGQRKGSDGIPTVIPTVIPTLLPIPNTSPAAAASVVVACERAQAAAAAAGIEVNSTDPRLMALVADGATPGEFRMAAAKATAAGKGVAWFYAAVSGMRRDVAAGNAQEGTKSGAGGPNYPMLPRWDDPH